MDELQAAYEPLWEPIDQLVADATAEMDIGEMITTSHFSLFDAMSAIELMEPNMDVGVSREGPPPMTADELPSQLGGRQLLSLIDRLNACEVAWYDGFPLAQTIFTCLWLHNGVCDTAHELLRTYGLLVVKTCGMLRELVITADLYEEEDFVVDLCGFDLLNQLDEQTVLKQAQEIELRLQSRIKWLKQLAKGVADQPPCEPPANLLPALSPDEPAFELECCEQLLARLVLKRVVLSGHTHLAKPQCKGTKQAAKAFNNAQHQIPLIVAAANLETSEELAAAGFEPALNRHLLGPSPPRTIILPAHSEGWEALGKHLETMLVVCAMEEQKDCLIERLVEFAGSGADIVARSSMKLAVLQDWKLFGKQTVDDFVWALVRAKVHIPDVTQVPQAVAMVVTIGKVIHQYVRILCCNPGRQHRSLAVALKDWGVLAADAEYVDQCVAAALDSDVPVHFFSHWVFGGMLRVSYLHAWRGVELQLHSPHELQAVLWYMEHFLRLEQKLGEVLSLQPAVVAASEAATAAAEKKPAPSKNKKNKGKKDKDKKQTKDNKAAAKPPKQTAEQMVVEAQRAVCQALCWLLSPLNYGRLEPVDPELKFGSDERRYRNRFTPYLKLPPPIGMRYEQLLDHRTALDECEMSILFESSMRLLRDANELLVKATRSNELPPAGLVDANRLADAVAQNMEHLQQIMPSVIAGGKQVLQQHTASLCFSAHSVLPVIVFVEI